MRALKTILLVLGLLFLGVLVYRVGAEPILETMRRLAWWQFVLICLPEPLNKSWAMAVIAVYRHASGAPRGPAEANLLVGEGGRQTRSRHINPN